MKKLQNLSNRPDLSGLQIIELKKNIVNDYLSFQYRRNRFWMFLKVKFPKSRLVNNLYCFNVLAMMTLFRRFGLPIQHYQPIIDDRYKEIREALCSLNVEITINGVNDIAGWNRMGAEYSPGFDVDARISIYSGAFYFAHCFCRCMQPFIIEYQANEKQPFLINWWNERQFRKTAIGYLTNNHLNAINYIIFVPWDDSMLFGMERFMILHEMAHAYCHQNNNGRLWPFSSKPATNIMDEGERCEEVYADMFAIYALHFMYKQDNSQRLLLFGPILYFLIWSWFEEDELVKKPANHPLSSERYKYLLNEVNRLMDNNEFGKYMEIMEGLWRRNENKICRIVKKRRREFEKIGYQDLLRDMGKMMSDRLDYLAKTDIKKKQKEIEG